MHIEEEEEKGPPRECFTTIGIQRPTGGDAVAGALTPAPSRTIILHTLPFRTHGLDWTSLSEIITSGPDSTLLLVSFSMGRSGTLPWTSVPGQQ